MSVLNTDGYGGEKLLTYDFLAISAVSLISGTYSIMLMTTVLLYGNAAGYSPAAAGLLSSSFAFASLVMRPFTGFLADRFSKKSLCMIGLAGYILAPLAFVFTKSYLLCLVGRIISGAAMAMTSTASSAIASEIIPKSRFTEGIGYFGIGMTVGAAVAPAIGLQLIARLGYGGMFLFSSAICAAAMALMASLPYSRYRVSAPPAQSPAGLKGIVDGMYERSAVFASASTLLITAAQISVSQFLPYYAQGRGVQDVSLFYLISAVGVLLPRLLGGAIKRMISDRKLLLMGYVILAAGYGVLFLTTPSGGAMVLSAVLYGFGHGTSSMALNSMAVIDAAPEKVGAANATYWAAGDLGFAVAPIAWGVYCGHMQYGGIYLISAILVSAALGAFIFRGRKKQEPQ